MKNQFGLIVVAYQGMGKTTLASKNKNYYDLESSGYSRENTGWYKKYVEDAFELVYEQHKYSVVFVSSHKVVRDYLIERGYSFVIFYPTISKDEMMKRLAKRYFSDKTIKNASALANCVLDYENNINELRTYPNAIACNSGYISETVLEEKLSKVGKEE